MVTATSKRYELLSALAAFLIWGGWAFYINDGLGPGVRFTSGLAQGTASTIITMVMVRSVTKIYRQLPDSILRLILPGIITVSITGSALAFIHYMVGTPRIISTISPVLTVAFAFCVYTAYKLHKTQRTNNDAGS
jgi:hypothetical protein